jgi:hypothetical protein
MGSLLLAADDGSGLPFYAYVFWTLFIVYLGWYLLRLYRKRENRRSTTAEPPPLIPPTPTSTRSASTPTAATPTAATPTERPTERPSPSDPSPSPSSAAREGPAAPRPAASGEDPPARTGLFAAGSGTDRAAERMRQPVARVLKGIAMPDELAPVINVDASDLSGLRVAFSAVGADPSRVGRAVGDELERLGFTLQSLSDTQLGAQRDDDELVVTIYTDPARVQRLGTPAFPALPAGAIVVEFESV